MKRNIGELDGVIRVITSFVMAYCYYAVEDPTNLQTIGLLAACYLIITATFGNDVFYRLFKISTISKKNTECQTCEKQCKC